VRKSGKTAALAAAAVGMLAFAGSAQAAFPGQNGLIAYTVKDPQFPCCQGMRTIRPDGTGVAPVPLVHSTGKGPRWTADGRTILFEQDPEFGGIAAFDTVTRTERTIIPAAERTFTGFPSPAPWDEIAFTSARTDVGGDTRAIEFMSADGSHRRVFHVRGFKGVAADPVWSPSGGWIAFTGVGQTGVPHVYVVRIDGPERTRRMKGRVLDWSPDGRNLLVRTDAGIGTTYAWEGPVKTIASDAFDGAYSPDGKRLVLSKEVTQGGNPTSDLFVTDLGGNLVKRLTNDLQAQELPSWQPITARRPQPPTGNRAPDCSAIDRRHFAMNASKKHRWRTFRIRAVDPNGDRLHYRLEGVTQDEPVTARGDRTSPDAKRGRFGNRVRLRRERNPRRNGRVYRPRWVVTDGHGGRCAAAIYVGVPLKKGGKAVNSGSRRYNAMQRD
jgi:hypothetical protein